MNNDKLRKGAGTSLIFLFLTTFAFLATNLQASTNPFKVEVGEVANAGRKPSRLSQALEFVFSEVIQAGTSWTLDNAANAFKPQQQSVSPVTRSSASYVGSSFVAMTNYQGRSVRIDYFATSNRQWYMWSRRSQQWQSIAAPAFQVYRTADIYRNSSGALFSLPPN